jgi:hypothetical protein
MMRVVHVRKAFFAGQPDLHNEIKDDILRQQLSGMIPGTLRAGVTY